MRRAVLKFAFLSALITPPVGLLMLIPVISVLARHWPVIGWNAIAFLIEISPIAVPLAYVLGAPAAFITGATAKYMSLRGYQMPWILAATPCVAAVASALTYRIGMIILAVPPGDSTNDMLSAAALGAVTTLVCAGFYFLIHRSPKTSPKTDEMV
jgi:hypothetical protein